MLVQEGLEGESGREGVRVEIQAPTSEGSEREAGAVRESRIPVRRRGEGAGTSSQSVSSFRAGFGWATNSHFWL